MNYGMLAGIIFGGGIISTVLQNGVALSGVINTTGGGTFRASNSNSNFFNGVTLNGNIDLATATGIERVTGGLLLNGSVSINNNSVLSFSGDQTLGGTGTIVLGSTGGSNRALGMEGNTVLTIGSNIVVRGQNGTIGQAYLIGGNQSLVNNGRVSADVLGGSVSLAPAGGITNNGVLEAKNGGTLVLNSDDVALAEQHGDAFFADRQRNVDQQRARGSQPETDGVERGECDIANAKLQRVVIDQQYLAHKGRRSYIGRMVNQNP